MFNDFIHFCSNKQRYRLAGLVYQKSLVGCPLQSPLSLYDMLMLVAIMSFIIYPSLFKTLELSGDAFHVLFVEKKSILWPCPVLNSTKWLRKQGHWTCIFSTCSLVYRWFDCSCWEKEISQRMPEVKETPKMLQNRQDKTVLSLKLQYNIV